MGYIVDLNEIETISAFSPPHHTTTKDRKLVDETIGAKNLAIWHGEIGIGGKADAHFHKEMEQAFFILDGEGIFRLGEEEHRVGKGCLVFIPAKLPHEVTPIGDAPLKLLMIMAPPQNPWPSGRRNERTRAVTGEKGGKKGLDRFEILLLKG